MNDLTDPVWIKSSYSGDEGDCVELAALPGKSMAVRDSKRPYSPVLCFLSTEWAAFRNSLKSGELSA
ncbi:DUF397 domain-containing protein [Sphaerisporangium album]|uniref:DUF397 domain-containing protein n=1 Tax=Sphaerisporangium album TaxID=509200 RepID=A0A367FC55_9ACTN|nr:DUF397 domain-containing protein [Sphaerisporangium album]RCG27914.1 DUF397 domain-containing protein [Sphaerisporangium album]